MFDITKVLSTVYIVEEIVLTLNLVPFASLELLENRCTEPMVGVQTQVTVGCGLPYIVQLKVKNFEHITGSITMFCGSLINDGATEIKTAWISNILFLRVYTATRKMLRFFTME